MIIIIITYTVIILKIIIRDGLTEKLIDNNNNEKMKNR